jgi:hypothetical protein
MSKQKGFYTQTKNGNVAHILGDENMSNETMSALEKMIDIAYHKNTGLGDLHKTQLIIMEELTFGQKAVGLNFNPSGDDAVGQAKQKFADAIDQLNDLRNTTTSGEVKRMCSVAITECQTAQMWAVKAITWKD